MVLIHQETNIFCMQNVNTLQNIWRSVYFSLILQAKFAECANADVLSVHCITL